MRILKVYNVCHTFQKGKCGHHLGFGRNPQKAQNDSVGAKVLFCFPLSVCASIPLKSVAYPTRLMHGEILVGLNTKGGRWHKLWQFAWVYLAIQNHHSAMLACLLYHTYRYIEPALKYILNLDYILYIFNHMMTQVDASFEGGWWSPWKKKEIMFY